MIYKQRRFFFILFLFLMTIIVITIFFINKFGLKTIEIEQTILEDGMDITAFIIQKEDVIYFNGKNNLEMEIQEGVKVPLGSVIASTKGTMFNNHNSLNLEIINWKLENGIHQEQSIFKQDLDKIYQEIKKLELNIKRKKNSNKYEEIDDLEKRKEQLIHKKQIIEGSFRFAFLDYEGLEELKNQLLNYEKNDHVIKGQISVKDMGINYPSYIYFQKDGLESLLHSDLLGNINIDYYNDIESLIDIENQSNYFENQQIIKFVDDTNLFLVIKVPKKFLSTQEENLLKVKNSVNAQWRKSGQANVFDFIEKRKEVLQRLPEVKLKWEDKIIKGKLLDSNHENADDQKIITVKIDRQNHKLVGKRQIKIYIYDNMYKGFMIPMNSIIQKNGKDGVVLLDKANNEIFTKIFIKNKVDEFVVLDPKENSKLKPGNKILANPK